MQQNELVIVKEHIITVETATVDGYGKLVVMGTDKIKYTLSEKRKALFSIFQPGAIINLRYGNYMNKDYIADAVKIGQVAPDKAQTASTPKRVEVVGPEHGLALKMVGDLFLGGKLKDDDALVAKMWAELHRIMGTGK